MNYIVAFVLGGTLLTVVVGALLGLLRGLRRSILRAALLVLCFVLALSLSGAFANSLIDIKVSDGKTFEELIASSFSDGGAAVTDLVVPLARAFAKVISFLLVFIVLQFITWVLVFPILKFVLRPFLGKRPHARLFGALVGVACGLFVSFAFFSPVNGLITDIGKIVSIDFSAMSGDGSSSSQSQQDQDETLNTMKTTLTDYTESGISKVYSGVGGGLYRTLSTVKNKDGEKVGISSQVDAITAAMNFATKVSSLKNINNPDGSLNTASVREFAKSLTELDELTPEAKKALTDMIKTATDSMGDDVPEAIKNIDFEEIDFKAEGNLLITLTDIADNEGSLENVDIDQMVSDLSKSTVILPTLDESNLTIPLDDETQSKVDHAIDELESKTGDEAVDAETIAKLKALFGNSENNG